MILRLEAWLVVLCIGMTTASESHPCPCIPRSLCPQVFGASPVEERVTGPLNPCSNPETVHCCGAFVSLQEQKPIHIVVAEELNKEEQLMAIVNNAIERMNQKYAVEDIQREDKSIGFTNENNFGCNKKQCNDNSEVKSRHSNETNTSSTVFSVQKELFNSSNTILSHSKSEAISGNGTVEKVYLVYAETPNKNNAYLRKESKAQIVLPTKEPKPETLPGGGRTTEESENEPQESSVDPIQVDTSVEENPDESLAQTKSKVSRYQRKNELHNRKSNRLQKLFPKRRPPPQVQSKNSKEEDESQQGGDDVDIAESNLDEVRDTETFDEHGVAEDYPDDEDVYDEVVSTEEEFQSQGSLPPSPTNSQNQTEQTESHRRPLLPRRLTPQVQRPDENKQTTKNALDLLRSRTKSRIDPTVHKTNEETMKTKQQEPVAEQIAREMDEINVRVLNSMIKSNFTGRSSMRPNTAFKSSRAPHNPLASTLNRNNQEQKKSESPSQPRRPTSQITQQLQPKPQTETLSPTNLIHEKSTNHGIGLSEENMSHRFQLKGRPSLRTQSIKPTSKLASPISITQEQAFDTSRDTPNTQVQARRQPSLRIRTRPQVTSQSTVDKLSNPQLSQISEDQPKQTQSVPHFARKHLPTRDRLRPRVENTNTNKNKQIEEPKGSNLPEMLKTTYKTNPLRIGAANEEVPITVHHDSISSVFKSGQDLDGSGSDFDIQQYQSRGNGKFIAPIELETGFRPMPPMMESRELKVVGPLPGGFLDPATGLSEGDKIGLELPNPNFQSQFKNEESFNHNNRPLTLLSPVFQMPKPQTTTRSQFTPKFPATETYQFFDQEETPQFQQGGDLTQIKNQFGTLKNQYDTLLNRYAETLNIYIGQYKTLINSAPPNIH